MLDARACDELSSSGGDRRIELHSDLLVLAKTFDLTQLTVAAASGTTPRVWWVTEDPVEDQRPTCADPSGGLRLDRTVIAAPVTAMAYTPCGISVGGLGGSTWHGTLYSGGWASSQALTFLGDPIVLPGQPEAIGAGVVPGPGSSTLGSLIARRDIP